jgi:peptidoglycan/LPS O-acetylase OafA/YrhL
MGNNSERFATLDAFRGVAAIVVVLFHSGVELGLWVPRFGYLAVDIFFLLSGFVLSHVYGKRLATGMSIAEFLRVRVVRLYPLYLVGLILGVASASVNADLAQVTTWSVGVNFVFNLFGLPAPMTDGFQLPGFRLLFPLNIPFWSLFFEFWVANVLFAFIVKFATTRTTILIVVVCLAGLLYDEKSFYTMDTGANWPTFFGGFARVGFSFFFGVIISKVVRARPVKWNAPAWVLTLVLVAALCLPLEDRAAHLYELACVIVAFPILIYLGAGALEQFPQVGERLGDASYAIYAVHFPLLMTLRWSLAKIAAHPGIVTQLSFAAILLAPAWMLSQIDTKLRRRLMRPFQRRVQTADIAQGRSAPRESV